MAFSATEVEFIACTETLKESLWLRGFTGQLKLVTNDAIDIIFCDNQFVIHVSKHPMFHSRSMHINIKLHFIMNIIEQGLVEIDEVFTRTIHLIPLICL